MLLDAHGTRRLPPRSHAGGDCSPRRHRRSSRAVAALQHPGLQLHRAAPPAASPRHHGTMAGSATASSQSATTRGASDGWRRRAARTANNSDRSGRRAAAAARASDGSHAAPPSRAMPKDGDVAWVGQTGPTRHRSSCVALPARVAAGTMPCPAAQCHTHGLVELGHHRSQRRVGPGHARSDHDVGVRGPHRTQGTEGRPQQASQSDAGRRMTRGLGHRQAQAPIVAHHVTRLCVTMA